MVQNSIPVPDQNINSNRETGEEQELHEENADHLDTDHSDSPDTDNSDMYSARDTTSCVNMETYRLW